MTLGEILHMGSATVGPVDQNQKDRHFVLFSSTLLILSVSARMSGFIYEVRQREIKLRGHSKTMLIRQGRYLQYVLVVILVRIKHVPFILCRSSQFQQMLNNYVNFDFYIMKKLLDLAHAKLVTILGGQYSTQPRNLLKSVYVN